jgi:hypothetical protein
MIQERRGIESPRRSLGLVPRMKLCSDREHFARPCPSRRRIREGWAALHWAAANGHNGAVRMLVVKGLDIAKKTDAGLAALYMAADNRQGFCGAAVAGRAALYLSTRR